MIIQEHKKKRCSVAGFMSQSIERTPLNSPKTQWALIETLENCNVQKTDFKQLAATALDLGLTKKEYANFLHINTRTLDRNLKEKFTLDIDKSEKILRLWQVMLRGIDTFGHKEKFAKWIREFNTALQKKPIELFSTIAGIELIDNTLTRIEHGVYS